MHAGAVVDQRFVIEHLAAAGGMGAVYRARDLLTGAPVALKVLLGAPLQADELRFEREALALAKLDHPGIVRHIAHHATGDGIRYLAMEWINGEDLARRIGRAPLSVAETTTLGLRLAEALGAAHARGVVHRDLKPSNILLAGGELERAKIVDFGLAKFPKALQATLSGTLVGTPAYMAPEQANGARYVDARADIFALGCIFHECLTGKPAFEGRHFMAVLLKIAFEAVPRLRDLGIDVPAGLDVLIESMVAKDPSVRPADAGKIVSALAALGTPEEPVCSAGMSLGRDELRFACVVVAHAPLGDAPDPTGSTLVGSDLPQSVYATLDAIRARGGRPVVLHGRTIAVTAGGSGLATDHAASAAEHALALRAALPRWAIAVTTARAEVAADRTLGEAIERAVRQLRARQLSAEVAGIDLDDVTAGMLDPRFDVTAGALGLELSGQRDLAEATRTLLGRPTTFVGRDRDLATIEALFAECAEESLARAVLVTAPAGVGKSRLRHELVQLIRAQGTAEIWIARGEPMRAGAPFGMLASLVRRAAHLFEGEGVEVWQQKLLARVSRNVVAPERQRVAEFLGELLGIRFPEEDRPQLRAARRDARLLGDQMRRAWVDFVGAETSSRPLVIVLEDMHWGDAPSAEYVDAALRSLHDRPLLVLAFARCEVHDQLPKLWHERAVQEIRLHELPRRACEQLARDVLGVRATPETIARLCERSAGNAFFLEELLRAAAEGRDDELPETVLAMVESRLDMLDAEDRRLLRAASIFGGVFWRGGLATLLPDDRGLGERLSRLEDAEWIAQRLAPKFRGEIEYKFRHSLIREAAYGTLTAEDRTLGHRLAGAWLEAQGESDAVLLAEHHELGGEVDSALHWYATAAERARERHAYPEAERLYDRALELLDSSSHVDLAAIHRGRGLTRSWLRRYGDALEDFSLAATMACEQGDIAAQIEILLDEATTLDWMSEFKRSEERVLEAQALAGEGSSPLLSARLLLGLGRTAHRFSRNEEAATLLERAGAEAGKLDDEGYETRIIALMMLGFIHQGLGRLDDAQRALDETIALCEAHGDRIHLGGAFSSRALVWSYLGDKERMAADMERALGLARELAQPLLEFVGEFNLGETLLMLDDAGAAEPYILRAIEIDRRLSGAEMRPVTALLLARLHLYRDEVREVRAILTRIRAREAEAQQRGEVDVLLVPAEEVVWSMLDLATRDAADAEWGDLEARALGYSQGYEQIEIIETRAMAVTRSGRMQEARSHLERAMGMASRVPNALGARLARRLRQLALVDD